MRVTAVSTAASSNGMRVAGLRMSWEVFEGKFTTLIMLRGDTPLIHRVPILGAVENGGLVQMSAQIAE